MLAMYSWYSPDVYKRQHKHDADGQRGDQRGSGDLRGAVENGLLNLLARLDVAIDVFNLDGCVVDQDADGQSESAEGHDVDGLAEHVEHDAVSYTHLRAGFPGRRCRNAAV